MDEEILQKVRELLGEHCPSWSIVAEDADGNFWNDYSTPITAYGLHQHACRQLEFELSFEGEEVFIEEWDEDDDGDGWKTQ